MSHVSEILANRVGSVATVICRGELDLRMSQELWRELESAIGSAEDVVVDFTEAVFVDTAIIACLARASRALRDHDKRLKTIVCQESHPWRALQTVGFNRILDFEVVPPEDC